MVTASAVVVGVVVTVDATSVGVVVTVEAVTVSVTCFVVVGIAGGVVGSGLHSTSVECSAVRMDTPSLSPSSTHAKRVVTVDFPETHFPDKV